MPRKRKHIPLIEMLASALADKLSQSERDELRQRKAPAREIVRMFTPDHVALHAWGGSDKWWNLTMARRGVKLKAKDGGDIVRWAKAYRIEHKWKDFMAALKKGKKPPARKRDKR